MSRSFFLLSIVFICIIFPSFSQDYAKISEIRKTMKTYPFSDPNPIPYPTIYYYPYFRFDGFAIESEDREWKVVEMDVEKTFPPEAKAKAVEMIENVMLAYDSRISSTSQNVQILKVPSSPDSPSASL